MDAYIDPTLLNLQSLFIDNSDPHAQHGAHVRVNHHPLLSLPVAPFILERADITAKNFGDLVLRNEALFTDQNNTMRKPPFAIGPRDEITVTLPTGPGINAVWAQIDIDPSGDHRPTGQAYGRSVASEDVFIGERRAMPISFSGNGIVRIVLRGRGTVTGVRWINAGDTQDINYRTVDLLNLPHAGGPRYAMLPDWETLCDARRHTQSPRRRPLQDTQGAPGPLAAPNFTRAQEQDRIATFFAELAVPLHRLITASPPPLDQVLVKDLLDENGYNISSDHSAQVKIRTLGMFLQSQADPGMASYCGYKTLDQDKNRSPNHILSLYRLTAYFRDPPSGVVDASLGRGEVFASPLQAAIAQGGLLSPRMVEELWMNEAGPFLADQNFSAGFALESGNCLALGAVAVADHRAPLARPVAPVLDEPEHKHWLPVEDAPDVRVTETGVRGLSLGATLAATRRQLPASANWYPQNSKVEANGQTWRALILPGIPQPGPFSAPIPAGGLPDAFLSDPATQAEEFQMYAAQMDRFGRYSDWADVLGAAGPRPLPPRPTVMASYRQPEIPSGSHIGRVTATVPMPDKDALAPGAYELVLARLSVTVDGVPFGLPLDLAASANVSIHPNPPVAPKDDRLAVRIEFDGPALAPMGSANLQIIAHWYDVEGQVSAPSEPAELVLHDPYPPAQTPIPDMLLYSARPDATGQAWVERRWNDAGSATRYAVYFADENRLNEHLRQTHQDFAGQILEQIDAAPNAAGRISILQTNGVSNPAQIDADLQTVTGGTAEEQDEARLQMLASHLPSEHLSVLKDIAAAADPAAKATIFRNEQHRFPGSVFERLKDAVVPVEGSPGQLGFRHPLSGSFRILAGYKIAAEAAATASRPDLTQVDTVFYAVPNSDPPPRPVITARQVPGIGAEPDLVVELTITVRPGVSHAQSARIRRTRSGVSDPLRNPVIATVPFDGVDPDTGLQTATYRDLGAANIAPSARFMPFVKYAWLAEAQGAPEPGSAATSDGPVPGLWSKPSAPGTLDVVPEGDPPAPTLVADRGTVQSVGTSGLELDFSYPVNLVPTSFGPWTVAVDRVRPAGRSEPVMRRAADAELGFTVAGDPDDATLFLPSGTILRTFVIDPLGRRSPTTEYIV
ncbi:MAG: hypothetical protein ABJM58_03695 [Alteripontixanthobacter sp.]